MKRSRTWSTSFGGEGLGARGLEARGLGAQGLGAGARAGVVKGSGIVPWDQGVGFSCLWHDEVKGVGAHEETLADERERAEREIQRDSFGSSGQ